MKSYLPFVVAAVSPLVTLGYAESLKSEQVIALGMNEGEVVSYSPGMQRLAVTSEVAGGVRSYRFASGQFVAGAAVDLVGYFGSQPAGGFTFGGVTSVALHPKDVDLGVASVKNATKNSDGIPGAGRVVFFRVSSGEVLGSAAVGVHPDMVTFCPKGDRVLVANEGEFVVDSPADADGSISVIDVRGVIGGGEAVARTVAFDGVNGLERLRYNAKIESGRESAHIEPEYVTVSASHDLAFVSLQENNAIGVFDLKAGAWQGVHSLGLLEQTIDASDKDKKVAIDKVVAGLPMPDAIASYEADGVVYLVSANEGDFRPDDGDRARVMDFTGEDQGGDAIEVDMGKKALGRLRVSVPDSDPDGDNALEKLVMPGTRSLSVWRFDPAAETLELAGDTGSLEAYLAEVDPTRHNANDGGDPEAFDKRSDDKGPEPEGVAVVKTASGRVLAVVGMERQNGLVVVDLTAPESPKPVGYLNDFDRGLRRPESVIAVDGSDSPTGEPMVIVGYEGDADEQINGGVGVYSLK
ncbi:choice-of-anchor I family protein [Sulfuriroseicoccus oceanibius]|uniref:Choice-of-anchor I family protein n=1 Tax=Sulfuriroseicoccus oceanibius TaxID=2707525 RepID=A0A6B3L7E7_9BACT|nr:choice-of-anchor I family protein [Sulfuriroseicoccus oceanibius]QQL45698.1 choice-of-anchor I family protein [Sulfuriroseicoccus oceanibius]